MSLNPVAVWRSSDRAVIQAWLGWREARGSWGDEIMRHSMAVAAQPAVITRVFTHEEYVGPGLAQGVEVPTGWREAPGREFDYDSARWLVPNKRTKAGKAAAAYIESIQRGPQLELPGMPMVVMTNRVWTAGVYADAEAATSLTAAWATEEASREVDEELWQRLPLSQWHAEQESRGVAS